jgi:phenylacetate-coenzyme A ligase PaaK-like adenylate-forming protein
VQHCAVDKEIVGPTGLKSRCQYPQEYYSRSSSFLDRALEQVAVYRGWRTLDPGPGYPVDCRFAAMPALTKKDLRENFPRGLMPSSMDLDRGIASGEIQIVETSGTTDDKVTNIWNQQWWDASEKASWKLNSWMEKIATGEHREAILVNPRNVGFISDSVDLSMEKRRLSRFLYLNEKTDPLSWPQGHMDRMIEELNLFKPDVFEANPSYLARLCRYIATHRKKVFQPGIIVFTYEYPTIWHYQQIGRVFTSPMVSSYGTTETGYVFVQCEQGCLHQNSEFCRVDFQPFKAEFGGFLTGRILVTPFNNPWSYILRFDTGDLVTIKEDCRCACGREGGLILASIEGRRVNLTLTCEGQPVTLHKLDSAISVLKDVEEFQLVQNGQTYYELALVSRRTDKARLIEEARQIVAGVYGDKANVAVTLKTAIAPESSGKYLYAKALIPIELESFLEKGKCQAGEESRGRKA